MKKLYKYSQEALGWFFEALFPEKCLMCRREGKYLCREHHCFTPPPENEVDFEYVDGIFASTAYYHEISEKIIEYYKFKGFKQVGRIMAAEMRKFLSEPDIEGGVLVPIPLHWTRWVWRGFNQSEVLVRELQKFNPYLRVSKSLKRKKRTSQQARLDKKERKKNLQEAFLWKDEVRVPKKVILVDDVVASGATLDMAAKELKRCGVGEVYALVFARGGGRKNNE